MVYIKEDTLYRETTYLSVFTYLLVGSRDFYVPFQSHSFSFLLSKEDSHPLPDGSGAPRKCLCWGGETLSTTCPVRHTCTVPFILFTSTDSSITNSTTCDMGLVSVKRVPHVTPDLRSVFRRTRRYIDPSRDNQVSFDSEHAK